MAYEDKVIDITAEELEATVKEKVPSLDEKVLKLERVPQYIKTNIDWNYNEDSTAISVQFGKDGESNNLYIRIAGTTGKPDSFGDLTDATAYDIRLERLVDTDDSIQDWSLSENVSDEELTLFRYISIRVATFWRNSNNEIVGFCAYGNENLLEQYISPLQAEIDSKRDMFYIAETSSLIDEADEYGNSFLDVKVDSLSENSTLQKDENGWIAVNTDVIPTQDDLATKAKKSKLEPIRTVIIGDETTYQDADIISYSDEEATQVQKIAICVDDNGKPFHLKETWIKSYLPSRTDTTSNYKFFCFPYTFVDLNSSGMPSSAAGMKLCNHIVEVSTLTTEYCNQCYTKFDDEANAYYGFDTGNYARSSVDAMTTWKSWGVNPKMIQDNAWGNTQRSVMCNGVLVSSKPEDVPLATGTKIEIYGVRKDED